MGEGVDKLTEPVAFALKFVGELTPALMFGVPGGKPVAIVLASVGFLVTAVSIVLACIPEDKEPNKTLAVVKVVGLSLVLVGIGVAVYLSGRRRAMAAS